MVLLAVIAVLIRATSVRLPLHVFFKFSGMFLFALAIVFAGNGVFELQNAGILLTTNLAWMGRGLPWAGLYPNLQVVSVQGLLLAGAILAWFVVPRVSLRTRSTGGLEHEPRGQARLSRRGRIAVLERWAGPIVVVLILGGVIANPGAQPEPQGPKLDEFDGPRKRSDPGRISGPRRHQGLAGSVRQPAGFREYPIGDEVEKNQMLIKAVWLPPVQMEGMDDPGSSNLIHLEADIHATEGNRNGFAKDEFVPYLIVRYTIAPADGKTPVAFTSRFKGAMTPMVARDGLHYGATIEMPKAGRYKLTYAIEPPSAGGLGRHVDPATGVEPWWKPFEVSFDWDFSPPPITPTTPER